MPGPITSSNMPINTIDSKTAEYMRNHPSAGLSAGLGGKLPKAYDITQQQLDNAAAGTRLTDIPTNSVDIDTLKTLEKTNPAAAERIRKNAGALPVNTTGKALEVQRMGTVGPTTYNVAQAEIKEGQEKEGIYGGSDYYAAKRAHEEAYKKNVKEGQEAKMLEHVAKVQPQQDVAKVKEAKNLVDEKKKATDNTNEPDGKTEETEQTDETNNKMKGAGRNVLNGMLNAIMQQQRGPNVLDASANANKALAQDYRNASANRQMEVQASQQIANQNPYTEAGKQASVQNDAQNRQNVQKAGVLGAGAALARTTTAPDVASEKAREDQQRNVAALQREKADEMQGMGTGAEGDSRTLATASQDYNRQMFEAGSLASGGYSSDASTANREAKKAEDSNKVENVKQEPQAKQEQETPGTPAQQPTQQQQTGAKQVDNNNAAIASASVGDWIIRNDGTKVTLTQQDIDYAKEHTVSSDERIKFIKDVASKGDDARMAWIKEDWEKNGMPDEGDFYWLLQKLGKFKCGEGECERERDIFNDDDWDDVDDSVLKGYAEHIKNYVYNYKPEAQNVDPTIDPNQEHIGPMAQDIEQVNPACVNETPEGVKTVDTARLAMMNAGAIADLAREVHEIKQMLGGMR